MDEFERFLRSEDVVNECGGRVRDIVREGEVVRAVGNLRAGKSILAPRRRPRSSNLGVPSTAGMG